MPQFSPGFLIALMVAPFIGSFLGVLVERLPKGQDVIAGRSRCTACGRTLSPMELVPVFSWLIQRGRCRGCGTPLGLFHPFMELAAAGVVLWTYAIVGPDAQAVTLVLGWTLLALAVMDARDLFLSDALTLPLIPAGLAFAWWLDPVVPWANIVGAVAGFGLVSGIALLYRAMRGREGLGFGDAKLMAGAGAWTGWEGLGTVLFLGVAVSFVILLVMRLGGKQLDAGTKVPLGTGLAVGIWLTWLYGPLLPVT